MKNYCVIIPAFNEEKTISTVVTNIYRIVKDIIVIDDCSSDSTKDMLKKLPVKVISNQTNAGYAKSLEKGFRYAFGMGYKYSISYDADGQHSPQDLKNIIRIIEEKKPDFVIGKRNCKNRFMEVVIGLYTKLKYNISDPFCGLKAVKRKLFDEYGYLENKYTIGTELYLKAARNDAYFEEIRISTQKRNGKSRFGNSFKGELQELRAFINILSL